MKNKIAVAAAAILALAGCVSSPNQAPLSWQIAASNDAVKGAIVATYAQDGFTVHSDSQYQIAMQRGNGAGSALRHSYVITGSNPTTISGSIQVVSGAGGAMESAADWSGLESGRQLMEGYVIRIRQAVAQ